MRTEKLIKKLHTEQAPQTKPKINLKAKAGKETNMRMSDTDKFQENTFKIFGKRKMIELMKTQFDDFTDLEADYNSFAYNRLDVNSECLEYLDDYGNMHNLYHGMVGGKEVCLYHIN